MSKKLRFVVKMGLLALYHIIISPILWLKPKYKQYVFVLTTGRSGSKSLSNTFQYSSFVNAFHEPFPVMNNKPKLDGRLLRVWCSFLFYFVKFPKILLSCKTKNTVYLETNHEFIKTFGRYSTKVFRGKLKLIHLIREPEKVAMSIYSLQHIPGTTGMGNKWYLNPYSRDNLISYSFIIEQLKQKETYNAVDEDFYRCLWYCYETEARIKEFIEKYPKLDLTKIQTQDLDNHKLLHNKFKEELGIDDIEIKDFSRLKDNKKNLKSKIKKREKKIYSSEKAEAYNKIFDDILE